MAPSTVAAASASSSRAARVCRPLLLSSDLDDTLLPSSPAHEPASALFRHVWHSARSNGSRCCLAVNTGRTLPLFQQAWARGQALLPQPDVLIAGVGTRVYYRRTHADGWQEDAAWTARMNEGWDAAQGRACVDALVAAFGARNVVYRADAEMHEHKLTAVYSAALHGELLPMLRESLQAAGITPTIIEGPHGDGAGWRFFDLLPGAAGKGAAMHHVRSSLGFDEADTVAAGDSVNDLLMLQQAHTSIIVGNSTPEVKAWAASAQQAATAAAGGAQPRRVVFVAQQPVAAGVLEGLQALGWVCDA